MRALVTAAILVATSITYASAVEVALNVAEHGGVARTGAPVRGGVPFARGVLEDCTSARLLDGAGQAIPCQVRPLSRWYDGSVKFLLVDTQVDLPADGQVALALIPGEDGAAPNALVVSEDAAQITVDTGAGRFVFSKTTFGVPAAAWADLDGDGTAETQVVSEPGQFVCEIEHQSPGEPQEENWLRDAAGGPREIFQAAAAGDYAAEIENANDLRAVVKLSGWLVNDQGRRLIQYVIRVHAVAGSAQLRLLPTFVYAGKPKEDFIRAMYLSFPMAQAGTGWALGGESRHEGALGAGDQVSLYESGPEKIYHLAPYTQDKSVSYTVAKSDTNIAEGKHAAGWARLAGPSAAMHLSVRNFWQMHPKALTITPTQMRFDIWPEEGGKVLDLRRRYDEVENTYHYDLSLWPYGGEGIGVTHELTLRLGPASEDVGAQMSAELAAPLVLGCTPEYVAETLAFGPIAPADGAAWPHLEALQDVSVAWIDQNQRAFNWNGMIDYGDTLFHGYATPSHYGYQGDNAWCSRGYVGWLNNDGTLTDSLFIHALRTGDYRTWLMAEAMVRHVMDVDTCHYCEAEPAQVGGGHRHDQQHWGNGVRGYGTATHGAIDYYLLTGDERALDVVGEYAQYHDTGVPSENEDRIGGLIRYWEITGDEHWKQRADELMAEELNVGPDNPWRFRTASHFRMVSNTSKSLMHYLYAAPPEDTEALREAIVASMDARYETYMSTWEDAGYLTMTLSALAYQITGDEKYAVETVALVQRLNVARAEPVPEAYLDAMRALPFPEMVETARAWRVNNVYSLGILQLGQLPYALGALEAAGMDQDAVFAVVRVNNPALPFEEVLDPEKMKRYSNYRGKEALMYTYTMENRAPSDKGGRSRVILLEDGVPLEPAHAGHIDTIINGEGRWSHWGSRGIYFSSSDNSDPRTNGREYRVVNPPLDE